MVGQCSMGPWPHNWYPWTPSQLAGDIFCPEKPLALGRLPSLSQDRAINQAQKKVFGGISHLEASDNLVTF